MTRGPDLVSVKPRRNQVSSLSARCWSLSVEINYGVILPLGWRRLDIVLIVRKRKPERKALLVHFSSLEEHDVLPFRPHRSDGE